MKSGDVGKRCVIKYTHTYSAVDFVNVGTRLANVIVFARNFLNCEID